MYETPFNLGKAIPLLACLGDVMGFKLGLDVGCCDSVLRQSLQSEVGHTRYKTLPIFTIYSTSVYFCGINPFVVCHIRCK
jgi:hypothetical protein